MTNIQISDTIQFHHGKRADYCVYSNGKVTRTWKKQIKEEPIAIYLSKGKATFKAGQRQFILKHVVANAFIPEYQKGMSVICIDGNELNCDIDNLCVMDNKQLGRLTGGMSRSQPVNVLNKRTGERFNYKSVRTAAKALHCSYQTILDYISGAVKKSVLIDYVILPDSLSFGGNLGEGAIINI